MVIKTSGKKKKYNSGLQRDDDSNKVDYSLVYLPLLKDWAEHLTEGAKKYGRNNWMKANSVEELEHAKSSAYRHFIQYMNNETDEMHHAALIFNLSVIEYLKNKLIM